VQLGASVGVTAFSYRRVNNDERDAADLADLLRMGRLPQAWIAPPATRELRQLVRHRAQLVALRSNVTCQVHAVLAGCGVPVTMSDLFGVAGSDLLDRLELPAACRARIDSAGADPGLPGRRDRGLLHPAEHAAARRCALSGAGRPFRASDLCWLRCSWPRSLT
jgi:transposase